MLYYLLLSGSENHSLTVAISDQFKVKARIKKNKLKISNVVAWKKKEKSIRTKLGRQSHLSYNKTHSYFPI